MRICRCWSGHPAFRFSDELPGGDDEKGDCFLFHIDYVGLQIKNGFVYEKYVYYTFVFYSKHIIYR